MKFNQEARNPGIEWYGAPLSGDKRADSNYANRHEIVLKQKSPGIGDWPQLAKAVGVGLFAL